MSRACTSVLLVLGAMVALGCEDTRLTDLTRVPASVIITVDPPQDAYRVGEQVRLGYLVLDSSGVVLPDVPATWESPPAGTVAQAADGLWEFIQEGEFTWRVRLDAPLDALTAEVTLRVPLTPSALEIVVDPDLPIFAVGDEVSVYYIVRDRLGAPLSGQPVDWQIPDPAAAEPVGADLYRLRGAGDLTWTASMGSPWNLSAARTLHVDGSGPELLLERPERGDTLRKDTPADEIPVLGRVIDGGAGVARVSVRTRDGQPREASVDPAGAFSLLVPAAPGLNTLEVVAEDTLGQTTRLTRAFYYAADFLPAEDAPARLVPQAWDASLLDRALDRGQPDDAQPYDPCAYDAAGVYACSPLSDLASLLEIGLNGVSFEALPDPIGQSFPLVDQSWDLLNLGVLVIGVRLQGRFDLVLSFSELDPGEAKVFELSSRDGGMHADIRYRAWIDPQGVVHPGLRAALGVLGTLTFEVSLNLDDLTGLTPLVACPIAHEIVINGHTLDEYLEICTLPPRPVAVIVSTLSSPALAALTASGMQVSADLLAYLDADAAPQVTLDQMTLQVEPGGLDLSALSGLEVDLGTLEFVGYPVVDLGTYQLDTQFIADLADQLLDPVLDALQPVLEWALGQLLTCEDALDPVCFFVPFLEDALAAFQPPAEIALADPFGGADPLAVAPFVSQLDEMSFRTGFGGRFEYAGRAGLPRAPSVAAHADDDHLGQPLLGGCLAADPGFTGRPSQGRGVQSVSALDLVNMLLMAAWDGGGLDLQLDEIALTLDPALDVSGLALALQPTLAPLVNRCTGEGAAFELQLGDLGFSLALTHGGAAYQATGYLSLAQAAGLAVQSEQLALAPGQVRHAVLELTALTVDGQPASEVQRSWLTGLLREQLGPAVLARVSQAAFAALAQLEPTFDLARFPELDPAQSTLVLGSRLAEVDQARVIVHADLTTP